MIDTPLIGAMELPTVIDNIHESCFRSSAVLQYVKIMLKRKDSHETILELINVLYYEDLIRPINRDANKNI